MPRRPGSTHSNFGWLKAIVFDFDGTLARLEIDFGVMRQKVLALAGEFLHDTSPYCDGYVLETVTAITSELSEGNADRARIFTSQAKELIETLEMEAAQKTSLFPYVRPALGALKEAEFQLAVITRNFGGAVRLVFPDLADYCRVFLPREAAPQVKPHPAHLLSALAALEVTPGQALMVGDHPTDIQAGQRSGVMTAGVASGRFGLEELIQAGADMAFLNMGELAEYLLGRSVMV